MGVVLDGGVGAWWGFLTSDVKLWCEVLPLCISEGDEAVRFVLVVLILLAAFGKGHHLLPRQ